MRKLGLGIRISLLFVAMMLMTAGNVLAVSYYEVGKSSLESGSSALSLGWYDGSTFTLTYTAGATRAIRFTQNEITSPTGDAISGTNIYQSISGIYTLSGSGSVYTLSLVSGTSSMKVRYIDNEEGLYATYLTATAKATQINFADYSISWEGITVSDVSNTLGSTVLDTIAADTTAGYTFAFTDFSIQEATTTINSWLSGNTEGGLIRYYTQLTGIAPAPEPAEWLLMFIGLGMLGYCLQRRGYLHFELVPQSIT